MFLRSKRRNKDGKEHRYWSIVENRRCGGNRVVQRQVLYLGEINDDQRAAWCKTIEVVHEGKGNPCQVAILPEDREAESTITTNWRLAVELCPSKDCPLYYVRPRSSAARPQPQARLERPRG